MKPSEALPLAAPFFGLVKNGVIVVNTNVRLTEGQAVRIEPVGPEGQSPISTERAEELEQLRNLFAQWDVEDNEIADGDSESFHESLQKNRGLSLRTPKLD